MLPFDALCIGANEGPCGEAGLRAAERVVLIDILRAIKTTIQKTWWSTDGLEPGTASTSVAEIICNVAMHVQYSAGSEACISSGAVILLRGRQWGLGALWNILL